MNRLHVVLPTNRKKFIGKVVEQFYDCEPHGLEVRLHIMFQSDPSFRLDNVFHKANEATDYIMDGWIMFLSDEDKLNPALFRRLTELFKQYPGKECFVFSQEYRDVHLSGTDLSETRRILKASPDNLKPGECGGGQYVIKRSLIGRIRHDFLNYLDNADGEFIRRIYLKSPDKFVFLDELMMSYDAFNWESIDERKEQTSAC